MSNSRMKPRIGIESLGIKKHKSSEEVLEIRTLPNGKVLIDGWCQVLRELGLMDCSGDCDTCFCG